VASASSSPSRAPGGNAIWPDIRDPVTGAVPLVLQEIPGLFAPPRPYSKPNKNIESFFQKFTGEKNCRKYTTVQRFLRSLNDAFASNSYTRYDAYVSLILGNFLAGKAANMVEQERLEAVNTASRAADRFELFNIPPDLKETSPDPALSATVRLQRLFLWLATKFTRTPLDSSPAILEETLANRNRDAISQIKLEFPDKFIGWDTAILQIKGLLATAPGVSRLDDAQKDAILRTEIRALLSRSSLGFVRVRPDDTSVLERFDNAIAQQFQINGGTVVTTDKMLSILSTWGEAADSDIRNAVTFTEPQRHSPAPAASAAREDRGRDGRDRDRARSSERDRDSRDQSPYRREHRDSHRDRSRDRDRDRRRSQSPVTPTPVLSMIGDDYDDKEEHEYEFVREYDREDDYGPPPMDTDLCYWVMEACNPAAYYNMESLNPPVIAAGPAAPPIHLPPPPETDSFQLHAVEVPTQSPSDPRVPCTLCGTITHRLENCQLAKQNEQGHKINDFCPEKLSRLPRQTTETLLSMSMAGPGLLKTMPPQVAQTYLKSLWSQVDFAFRNRANPQGRPPFRQDYRGGGDRPYQSGGGYGGHHGNQSNSYSSFPRNHGGGYPPTQRPYFGSPNQANGGNH
jgi:hypothetical protein